MDIYDWRSKVTPEMSRWMARYLDKVTQTTTELANALEQIDQIMLENRRSEKKQKEALLAMYEQLRKDTIS